MSATICFTWIGKRTKLFCPLPFPFDFQNSVFVNLDPHFFLLCFKWVTSTDKVFYKVFLVNQYKYVYIRNKGSASARCLS